MDKWTRDERAYFEGLSLGEARGKDPDYIWHYPNLWFLFRRIDEYRKRFPGRRLRVLDLGCGAALSPWSFFHRKRVRPWYFGLDLSHGHLARARRLFPEAFFIQADAQAIPLASSRFDFVLSLGALHHVRDITGCLEGFSSLLIAGGEALLQEPNPLAFRYWGGTSPRERPVSHNDLLRASLQAGLRLTEVRSVNSPAILILRRWLKRAGLGFVQRPRFFWWLKTRLEIAWEPLGERVELLRGMNSFYVLTKPGSGAPPELPYRLPST
jgi:SAM-dependent methyltransferase